MEPYTSTLHLTHTKIKREEQEIGEAMQNPKRFGVLYDRYYLNIFKFIFKRIESEEVTADITSQVFVKALSNLKSYEFRGVPFGAWLFQIARNEVNLAHRKQKAQRIISLNDQNVKDIIEEDELDDDDRMELVVRAIQEMDKDEIELIEMKYFEKRPYKEICEILGLSEGNAKVKVHRAVNKIKSIIFK